MSHEDLALSVVIPTFNRRAMLDRTLPTVLDQSLASDRYEVVVVADGSTDGTSDLLRDYQASHDLHFLEQPNRGQAAARNTGVAAATGKLILFLDDDLLCSPVLLEEHLRAQASREGPALVFGPVLVAPQSRVSLATSSLRADVEITIARLLGHRTVDAAMDVTVYPNSSVPRDLILEFGGFDEHFVRAGEDTELGLRLWGKGIEFHFQPTARTEQIFTKRASTIVREEAPQYGRNEVLLWKRHPEFRRRTALARLPEGPLWKRVSRRAASRMPRTVARLTTVGVGVAEALWNIPGAEPAGIKVFRSTRGAAMLAAAIREVDSWDEIRSQFAVRLPVLLYHHVGPAEPGADPRFTLTPERFESHIRWLARSGFVSIRADEWLSWREGGHALPARPIVLTFDDSYADVIRYTLPILRHYGYSATLFAVSSGALPWTSWDAKAVPARPLSNRPELHRWLEAGMEIGAHTRTHPNLTTLAGPELEREVRGSQEDLQQMIGSPVRSFSYPYGCHNVTVVREVAKVFDTAFTVEDTMNDIRADPFLLSRLLVRGDDSIFDLLSRVHLGHRPLERMRSRFRLRTRMRRSWPGT